MANVVLQNLHVGPAAVSPSHDIEVFACTIEQEGFDGSLACKRKGRQWLIQTMVNGAVRSEQAYPTALQQGDDAVNPGESREGAVAGNVRDADPPVEGIESSTMRHADDFARQTTPVFPGRRWQAVAVESVNGQRDDLVQMEEQYTVQLLGTPPSLGC